MRLEVAPGVELRVARQAVLRKVEDATEPDPPVDGATDGPDEPGPAAPGPNV
jgi:hypothetical protein